MEDLYLYTDVEIVAWAKDLRRQLNTAATSITFAGGGGAMYSPTEARRLIKELIHELKAREGKARSSSCRVYAVRARPY